MLSNVSRSGKLWVGPAFGEKKHRVLKRLFFVEGHPRAGKTDLIIHLLERLRKRHPDLKVRGFYTRQSVQDEFQVITANGQEHLFASAYPILGCANPQMFKRLRVDVQGFENLVLPELQVDPDTNTQLFILDAIDEMQLLSHSYFPAVKRILSSQVLVLGSLPSPHRSFNIEEVEAIRKRPDLELYTLNRRNWGEKAKHLYARINGVFCAK